MSKTATLSQKHVLGGKELIFTPNQLIVRDLTGKKPEFSKPLRAIEPNYERCKYLPIAWLASCFGLSLTLLIFIIAPLLLQTSWPDAELLQGLIFFIACTGIISYSNAVNEIQFFDAKSGKSFLKIPCQKVKKEPLQAFVKELIERCEKTLPELEKLPDLLTIYNIINPKEYLLIKHQIKSMQERPAEKTNTIVPLRKKKTTQIIAEEPCNE